MHNGILITTIRFSKALKSYVGTLVLLQGDGLLILPLSVLFHTCGVDITGYSLHIFLLTLMIMIIPLWGIILSFAEGGKGACYFTKIMLKLICCIAFHTFASICLHESLFDRSPNIELK